VGRCYRRCPDLDHHHEFGSLTNVIGLGPYSQLMHGPGGMLYGTTFWGGTSNLGTVFKMNTDGTGYTVLKHFIWQDGMYPLAGLTSSDSVLYGTTPSGGSPEGGTVLRLNTDGTGYSVLMSFPECADARGPPGGLTLSGNMLYGTTSSGGSSNLGTVFMLNTDGTGYAVLKSFAGASEGAKPVGGLALSGNVLYGTTEAGGIFDSGTLFKLELSLPVSLTAQPLGDAIILTWSNPAFALQAAPSVAGTYTNISGATSPYTNVISGTQKFFRLVGN